MTSNKTWDLLDDKIIGDELGFSKTQATYCNNFRHGNDHFNILEFANTKQRQNMIILLIAAV